MLEALAAVVHAMVVTLAERFDAADLPEPAESWKIAENRWSAARHGVLGRWVDVHTGRATDTRAHVAALLAGLEPAAPPPHAWAARPSSRAPGDPPSQRARGAGPHGLAASLAERFLDASGVRDPASA